MNEANRNFRRENDIIPHNEHPEQDTRNKAFFRRDTDVGTEVPCESNTLEQESVESTMSHVRRLRSAEATSAATRDAEHLRSVMNGTRNGISGDNDKGAPKNSRVDGEPIPLPGLEGQAAGMEHQGYDTATDSDTLSSPGPITLGGLQRMKNASQSQHREGTDLPHGAMEGRTSTVNTSHSESDEVGNTEDRYKLNLRYHSGIPPTELSEIPPYNKGVFEPFDVSSRNNRLRSFGGWLAIAAGLGIAILLYGGGGDYLSGVFGNENERLVPDERADVTESSIVGTLEPEEPPPGFGVDIDAVGTRGALSEIESAPSVQQAMREVPRSATASATGNPVTVRTASREMGSEVNSGADNDSHSPAEPPIEQSEVVVPPKSEDIFSVQVSATSDKEDAEEVAQTLRSKGLRNVVVLSTRKDGDALYRVRFGSFTTRDAALSAAGKAGYDDIWIAKQE